MLKSIKFLSGKSSGRVGGGSTSVCSVILRRYSLLEVPGRRIHNVIAKAMSVCVAYGNKVMDTRLPQPAGCGDKYDVSGLGLGRLLSAFCTFFKYPSPDAKASPSPSRGEGSRLLRRYPPRNDGASSGEGWHRPWCHKILGTRPSMTGGRGAGFVRLLRRYTLSNDGSSNGEGLHRTWCNKILGTDCASRPRMTGGRGANSFGRSMIEMLGVLAIIGVLSVGGIAGYSKAMEQYKLNKVLNQYSHLLQGLIEYGGKMRNSGNYDVQLGDAVNAIGLIPSTWHYLNSSGLQNFQDDIGNTVHIVSREGDLVFNLSLHANDAQFSSKTCVNFFQYIFQPLHSTFKRIVMFDMNSVNPNQWYFGDSLCSNYNCLNNMTLSAMHNACGYCAEREGSGCFMVIQF